MPEPEGPAEPTTAVGRKNNILKTKKQKTNKNIDPLDITFNSDYIVQLIRIPLAFANLKTQALIDTGAAASFISMQILKKIPVEYMIDKSLTNNTRPIFKTVSGDVVRAKGFYEVKLKFDNEHKLSHCFYVIDRLDEGCILGIDFLTKHSMTINARERSISYKRNEQIETLTIPTIPLYGIKVEPDNRFNLPDVPIEYLAKTRALLNANTKLFAEKMSELGMATAIKHNINTGNTLPIKLSHRRTPEALKMIVKSHIEEMEAHNIIRESTSPYAAPVVMVPKKKGELRFCIDYRQLNKATIKDRYPLPRIDDTIDALHGAQYFSTLDLFSGYWQIEIDEADKYKTAFVCEYGQYEFNRMPFGLTNAPGTFQRLMNKILKPVLYISALVYLDDIIVFSKSIDEHIEHLATVFKLLAEAGLKLKLNKCEFFRDKIDYLGHVVSREGVAPNEQKIISITNYPVPKNVKEVSSFLGLASYYRKFIRAFAEKAHSLTKLTRKNVAWEWGNEQKEAFKCIQNCLTSKPLLRYPDFTREFIVYTDASGYGIGAVLAQVQRLPHSEDTGSVSSDQEVVIAYSSKHLNDREAKWSTTEKEAFAIIHAIDVFKPYLYGRKFTVITDHKPLEWLMTKVEPSGRLARWALKIQEYDIVIGYRSGKTNQNADCLSRVPIPTIAVITLQQNDDWADAQRNDEFCTSMFEKIDKGIETDYMIDPDTLILVDKQGRLVVPDAKVREIVEMNHDHMLAGHLGVAKTFARLLRQYAWPKMRQDVKQHVKDCLQCAKRKAYGSRKAPLKPMPPAVRVWEKIAMDIVGPVTESIYGNRYILVLSDYASRFVITIPMENQKARTVAAHFVNKVITKYGAPESVLTDQGTNFLSKLVESICSFFKIKQMRTTSYHPQTDGLVERFNRTLCDMLACYVSEEPDLWDKYLPFVTLAYNTSEQTSVHNTPFYLFFGREPTLPNDIIINRRYQSTEDDYDIYSQQWQRAIELARSHLLEAQNKQKVNYDKGSKILNLKVNDIVLLKAHSTPGKFNNRWYGPYVIIRKISDLNYEITKLDKTEIGPTKLIVHVNRLKKQTLSVTAEDAYRRKVLEKEHVAYENNLVKKSKKIKRKKRVGRPRKTVATANSNKPALTSKKNPVGRPRKNILPTIADSLIPEQPKRKVGRPRKNTYVVEKTVVTKDQNPNRRITGQSSTDRDFEVTDSSTTREEEKSSPSSCFHPSRTQKIYKRKPSLDPHTRHYSLRSATRRVQRF